MRSFIPAAFITTEPTPEHAFAKVSAWVSQLATSGAGDASSSTADVTVAADGLLLLWRAYADPARHGPVERLALTPPEVPWPKP